MGNFQPGPWPETAGIKKAAQAIVIFNVATVAFSLVLPAVALSGATYCVVAALAGVWFLLENRKLADSPSESQGFRIFSASMPYLAVLMGGLLVDKLFCVGVL